MRISWRAKVWCAAFMLFSCIPIFAAVWFCTTSERPMPSVIADAPSDAEVIHQKSKELAAAFSEQLKSSSLSDEERRQLTDAVEYHNRIMDKCEAEYPQLKRRR